MPVHLMDKLDLEIGGGWTIVQGTSFLPVTKRVPHVVEEEHGRKRTSLLRGSEYAAGYLAGGEGKFKKDQDVSKLAWKKFDLKV